ncbi:ArsR family transcriptional regulator [Embleya sp. NPDC020630]|uniref:ArsR/SmtB family transcription factor n=1 Tax=Embleya sp. NPDC020630 TaxID=3363979 RepID=UPI003793A84F
MLRIHFTAADLARTRVVDGWGPLGETMLSLTTLSRGNAHALLGGWRTRVRGESAGGVHPFASLFDSQALDLFTVTGATPHLEEGLEALSAAGPDHLHTELAYGERIRALHTGRPDRGPGAGMGDFAHDRSRRSDLVRFLRDHHRIAIAPHWSRIHPRFLAEQADRAHALATHGVEAMLAGLPPGFRWRPPYLEIGRGPVTRDVVLGGRGLQLVPSVFAQYPLSYEFVGGEGDQTVVFLPVMRTAADAAQLLADPQTTRNHNALAALLGRTRARALEAVGDGHCTTGQLAQRLTMSPATASEHATVLRESGLITTTRHGGAVLHALTPLGGALLNGAPDQSHARRSATPAIPEPAAAPGEGHISQRRSGPSAQAMAGRGPTVMPKS